MGKLLRALAGLVVLFASIPVSASADSPSVLLVCPDTTKCPGARFDTIQSAVDAAKPGDWILIGPGVYHENANPKDGVLITTPDIHLRGMDRNRVVVDGSNGAGAPCPSDAASQNLSGRNGIVDYKTDGVSIDNLTVCNYLADTYGNGGNEVWFNGGDGSGKMGRYAWEGGWLTTTATYFDTSKPSSSPMGMYGLFVSNTSGPGLLQYSYASNMGDSGIYVGACSDCNATLNHVHSENNALGYSGTNSGGHLVIENSEWDKNLSGIVPNSLNNDDAPSPQSGQCPDAPGTSCTFIQDNYVHDNNNPNVPRAGIAGAGPVGTGIEIVGGSYDTIRNNDVENNNAWGIVVHDYPDNEQPPATDNCYGGYPPNQGEPFCFYNSFGNVVTGNTFKNNGSYGNPTNGDIGIEASGNPRNCVYGNTDASGTVSEDPPQVDTIDGQPCNLPGVGDSGVLAAELVCDAQIVTTCDPAPVANYPVQTTTTLLPVPTEQSMPNPCDGVPANPWCPHGDSIFASASKTFIWMPLWV